MAAGAGSSSQRSLSELVVYPRVLAVWSSREKFEKFEEIYDCLKVELGARGIELIRDGDAGAQGCRLGIAFITESFLAESCERIIDLDIKVLGHPYATIFCDEPHRRYCKPIIDGEETLLPNQYDDDDDDDEENKDLFLRLEVNAYKKRSFPPWSYTVLGDTDQARTIAREYVPHAHKFFNPNPVEYTLNDPSLASLVFNLNFKLFIAPDESVTDNARVTFGFFITQCACPMCSERISIIHNLLFNINHRSNYHHIPYLSNLPHSDDPFFFNMLLLEWLYTEIKQPEARLKTHQQYKRKKERYLIFIDGSDFSPHVFKQQLKNLTTLIGKGSLVITTARKSTRLFYLEPAQWEVPPVPLCGKQMRPLYCRMFDSDLTAKSKVSPTVERQNLQKDPSKVEHHPPDKSTKGKRHHRVSGLIRHFVN